MQTATSFAPIAPHKRAVKLPPKKVSIRYNGMEFVHAVPKMSDKDFVAFCEANPDLRIETDIHGNIIIMPPSSLESGNNEVESMLDLGYWNRINNLGKVFSSQTKFTLPDGSKRMPDTAWIQTTRYDQLSDAEKQTYAHIVPDFIIEVASPSDDIEDLKVKIKDVWIANGVRLAWLLDPANGKAWAYRANGGMEEFTGFDQTLSGEEVLPGFVFYMKIFVKR